MKKILLATFLLATVKTGLCQTSNLIKKNFISGAEITVTLFDYLEKKPLGKHLIFPANWKFKVVGITSDNKLIVKQWVSKKEGSDKNEIQERDEVKLTDLSDIETEQVYTSSNNNHQFFTIELSEFDSKCDPYFARGLDFTFGVMTIPIKLRASSSTRGTYFEFEEKFNIGVSAGIKYSFNSRKDRSLSLLMNTSVSNVRVDSLNTKGFQQTAANNGAFTIATGLVFKQNDFNIGFFVGWDKVPGVLGKNWVHYGKPWVGVGIGFSLFSINLESSTTGNNNK